MRQSLLDWRYRYTPLVLTLLVYAGHRGRADEPARPRVDRPNHARPFGGKQAPALLTLPPGAVRPEGWLRDWAEVVRDGCTGRMEEVDEAFRKAWSMELQQRGEGLNWPQGAWPYEGGGYWFDGLARLGGALQDPALLELAKRRLSVVFDHMNDHAILFLWWLDRNKEGDLAAARDVGGGWSLWASGLLGRALSGYYAATGEPRAVEALVHAYGFTPEQLRRIEAHEPSEWPANNLSNLWPAYDTYTYTGDPAVAATLDAVLKADSALLGPAVMRFRKPPDLSPGAAVDNAHVVEFLEITTPWAAAYLWTGDEEYLKAALGWHELLDRVAMQPTGVPVADEFYGPTGAFRGTETCDVAGYVWSQLSLLAVTGDGRLADRAERAFFNAGPATLARDARSHVYFQSPNRFAASSPPFVHGPGASGGNFAPTHQPLCCTAAVNRIVPWYVTNMWMATADNGLAATVYGPSTVKALVADRVPVTIASRTAYPFDETITFEMNPEKTASWPLSLRVPGWCMSPQLKINGQSLEVRPDRQGFVRLLREWKMGDRIELRLPMAPRVEQAYDRNSQIPPDLSHLPLKVVVPAPNAKTGAPYVTVSYGPLLFALGLPESHGDPNIVDPQARWQYALDPSTTTAEVVRAGSPGPRWNWPLEAPLRIRVNAVPIAWAPRPEAPLLPAAPAAAAGPAESLELVPYGCTKFRISMFPMAADPRPQSRLEDVRKILVLGNSITRHGPAPEIGWDGDWGMAASAPERDFAHILAAEIGRENGQAPELRAHNIADFEREYSAYDVQRNLKEALDFDADLIVLAIGENVAEFKSDAEADQFRAAVNHLLNRLKEAGSTRQPLIAVRSCFTPVDAKDRILREAAEAAGAVFVDIAEVGRDPANQARSERVFSHEGVGGHPGDRGMKAIAGKLLEALPTERRKSR